MSTSTILASGDSSNEVRIIAPQGMLGYGYDAAAFLDCCETKRPHAIICDSGSTDSGPQKLALGLTTCPREAYVRDLGPLVLASAKYKIPVLIGSCGGSGTNAQVDLFAEIVRELAQAHGYHLRVAKIYTEVDKDVVRSGIAKGKVSPCGPVPPLTIEDVDATTVIVSQIGAEPYMAALNAEEPVDIILGGRGYDPAPFAAVCLRRGIDPGVAWHMGKLECGGMCMEPKQSTIFATIRRDSFDLEPITSHSRCTVTSVAAHTLYEKTRPDLLPGPGGVLNLQQTTYEQLTPHAVRVRGGRFEPRPYQVKLEGARVMGFRSIFVGGIREPGLIAQIDTVLPRLEMYARAMNPTFKGRDCRIAFHVYGKNGVMGPLEPHKAPAHELCVLGEVLAPTQALAHGVCNALRVALLHCPYPYQIATGGNLASPLTPLETDTGGASEFSVYHLLDIDDPVAPFPIVYETIGEPSGAKNESRWPAYAHPKADKEKGEPSAAEQALGRVRSEMAALRVDPVAKWRSGIERGEKTIKLRDAATVLRSKNSGPYELTFDVLLPNDEIFEAVRASGALTQDVLARAYNVKPETVLACLFFEQAKAFKFTIPRASPNGSFGETDMHGCQQHIPLADIDIPFPAAN